jgi:hypothetical protein
LRARLFASGAVRGRTDATPLEVALVVGIHQPGCVVFTGSPRAGRAPPRRRHPVRVARSRSERGHRVQAFCAGRRVGHERPTPRGGAECGCEDCRGRESVAHSSKSRQTPRAQACPSLRVLDISGWPMVRDGPLLRTLIDILARVRVYVCAGGVGTSHLTPPSRAPQVRSTAHRPRLRVLRPRRPGSGAPAVCVDGESSGRIVHIAPTHVAHRAARGPSS